MIRVPNQRAVYYHLEDGSIQLPDGAFYRPRGSRRIEERPADVESMESFGHWEMDTVVSGRGGKGGLLVLIERKTRFYIIRYLNPISQRTVLRRLRELSASGCFGVMRSMATDNGCEFLNQRTIVRAPVPRFTTRTPMRLMGERIRGEREQDGQALVSEGDGPVPSQK